MSKQSPQTPTHCAQETDTSIAEAQKLPLCMNLNYQYQQTAFAVFLHSKPAREAEMEIVVQQTTPVAIPQIIVAMVAKMPLDIARMSVTTVPAVMACHALEVDMEIVVPNMATVEAPRIFVERDVSPSLGIVQPVHLQRVLLPVRLLPPYTRHLSFQPRPVCRPVYYLAVCPLAHQQLHHIAVSYRAVHPPAPQAFQSQLHPHGLSTQTVRIAPYQDVSLRQQITFTLLTIYGLFPAQ